VQLSAAQLAVDNARLEMRNAEMALNQRTIRTPVAGTVGLIQVLPGNLVNAQTVVTTVEDSSEILINFWVPERYASQIALGTPVVASSVALPGQVFEGTVSATDNRIDPQSRTLQVQATLPNDTGTIRPGMSFSVSMTFAGQTFPAVDPLSIQWSNEGAYVWKVTDGKVDRAMVEIVQRNSDGVLVDGEVAPGDMVVTQGVLQLSPGLAVRLLDE
jgi:RND family efflux transporter MFP subunit